MFSNWTDRVAAGEVPPAPPRPQGLERNVVISQWDWGHQFIYVHDLTVTDNVRFWARACGATRPPRAR